VLLVGAAAQLLAEVGATPSGWGLPAVLGSYLAILAFAARNASLTGMPLVLAGVALNLAVTAANGGMPVRGDAVVRAGLADRSDLPALDLGAKRHLESEDDVLRPLGDVLPLRPLREVVSGGDVVLAAGLAALSWRLLGGRASSSPRTGDHAGLRSVRGRPRRPPTARGLAPSPRSPSSRSASAASTACRWSPTPGRVASPAPGTGW
jgi:hypothetical protein